MSQASAPTAAHILKSDNDYFQLSDDDLEYSEDFNDEDVDAVNNSNGNNGSLGARGSYERAWTTEATRALIHIRGPMQGMFTEGRQKRTALWLHCTRQLHKMGYRHSAAKVQKKWHNILITYTKNLPKKNTSGYVHWEFFDDMHKYLKDRKFEPFNFPIQAARPAKPVMPQHQQQQQQPLSQPPPMTFHQTIRDPNPHPPQQAQISTNDLMAQYGDANQLALLAHTAEANMNDNKSNDEFDDDSTNMSEFKQPKLEFNPADLPLEISHSNGFETSARDCADFQPSVINGAAPEGEGMWWKDYFERKLEVEREKIQCQKELHREQMQFQKMSLVQQEKIERLKIDAINSLTATLQKLVEAKNRKA